MTAPTPEQMRELAGVLDRCANNDRNAVRVSLLHESAAALRTAADQLEAVQGALWGGSVTTSAVVRVANAREFIPRSTSDTAPQEGDND